METQTKWMIAIAIVIVVVIALLVYYRKDLYTPAPPSSAEDALQDLAKVGGVFPLHASPADLHAAKMMQSSFAAFSQEAKAGQILAAIKSFNYGLEAMMAISPQSIVGSVTSAHPQACIPPEVGLEIGLITNELQKTASHVSGASSWAGKIAEGMPSCRPPTVTA